MANTYSNRILADGPIAYYRLGETSGTTAFDSTSNKYNGTIHATTTLNQTGAILHDANTAMKFDGVSGYVSLPSGLNINGFTALTIEFWIKFTTLPLVGAEAIIGTDLVQANNVGAVIYFNQDGQGAVFALGNGTGNTITGTGATITAGTYVYVVGTWSGSTMKLSINAGTQNPATFNGPISTSSTFSIAHNTQGTDFLQGTVDEVAIYNKALTPAQITAHYNLALANNIQLTGSTRREERR